MLDDEGEVVARAPGFEEALLVVDIDPAEAFGRRLRDVRRRELERSRAAPRPTVIDAPARRADVPGPAPVAARSRRSSRELEQMRLALGLGLRDYVEKNGFGDIVARDLAAASTRR